MNGKVVLSPANPAEREIEIQPGDDFGILGVVCGVFRPFVTMEQQSAEQSRN
jgi:SOS-response transcriptional repressor LexA